MITKIFKGIKNMNKEQTNHNYLSEAAVSLRYRLPTYLKSDLQEKQN